jgi:protein-disulfide isomerase
MSRRRPTRRATGVLLAGFVAVAAAAAVALIHWTGATSRSPARPPAIAPAAGERGAKWRGRADAPVTIEVYSDFLCAHCADFAATIEPALIAEFVDTGLARLVFRHFPVLGPGAQAAAEASECAADQGRFWPYHDALYERARRGALRSPGDLDAAARAVGLDATAFATCSREGIGRSRVDADRAEGLRRGVQGTPTTFIGGRAIIGVHPLDAYRAAVRDAQPR